MNYTLPKQFKINRENNEVSICICPEDDYWTWRSYGTKYSIEWSSFTGDFKILLKLFILKRMKHLSFETISRGDVSFLHELIKFNILLPFNENLINNFLTNASENKHIFTLRKFYEFGLSLSNKYFNHEYYLKLKEFKVNSKNPYERVFLQQNFVSDQQAALIRSFITAGLKEDFTSLRDNIILQIAFELAPRPSQFHLLNSKDFRHTKGNSKDYFSLELPMSKKIRSTKIEKRKRSITKELGLKFKEYLRLRNLYKLDDALFISKSGRRLPSSEFTIIIKKQLRSIGLNLAPTDLRHYLAQSLADQGASADIIAEIMGHNSTVPARAYIAATPKIAEIKAKALAKSTRYNEIMQRLTGELIDEENVDENQRAHGLVGNQYIGGIGKCGLPNDTSCPKNPVYSCYTCIKFHPFRKSEQHQTVKEELQKQVQFYIDISEKGNDLEYNRPVTQLKNTIEAVENVINIIEHGE